MNQRHSDNGWDKRQTAVASCPDARRYLDRRSAVGGLTGDHGLDLVAASHQPIAADRAAARGDSGRSSEGPPAGGTQGAEATAPADRADHPRRSGGGDRVDREAPDTRGRCRRGGSIRSGDGRTGDRHRPVGATSDRCAARPGAHGRQLGAVGNRPNDHYDDQLNVSTGGSHRSGRSRAQRPSSAIAPTENHAARDDLDHHDSANRHDVDKRTGRRAGQHRPGRLRGAGRGARPDRPLRPRPEGVAAAAVGRRG